MSGAARLPRQAGERQWIAFRHQIVDPPGLLQRPFEIPFDHRMDRPVKRLDPLNCSNGHFSGAYLACSNRGRNRPALLRPSTSSNKSMTWLLLMLELANGRFHGANRHAPQNIKGRWVRANWQAHALRRPMPAIENRSCRRGKGRS